MIDVSLRESNKDDLAVGIRAVVDSLAVILSNRCLRRDLAYDVDARDPIAGSKTPNCEDPDALD